MEHAGRPEMMQANLFQVSPESSPTPDCSLAGQQSGEVLKTVGMEAAAKYRRLELEYVQLVARGLAERVFRPITIDDVRELMEARGQKVDYLGNAAGSVFKGPEWEFVEFVKSTRPSNHSRYVRSWRLK